MTVTTAATTPAGAPGSTPSAEELAQLLTALQSSGLRVEVPLAARAGGAGPADAGMLYIEGVQTTVPTGAAYVANSPYALRGEDDGGWAVYRGTDRLASAALAARPRYYDLTTADGIPYHQIALLHLDSVASTVLQTCAYWGNDDQCTFCGIGVTLAAGRTIAKKTPAMLAEVALAAKELDGAVDATLTTGSTATPDRGAMYVGRCGEAVKAAAGLPVQVQFEPPADLDVIDRVADMGIDSVGIHVETFDPAVLARVAPGKARWGIEAYFSAWERAVKAAAGLPVQVQFEPPADLDVIDRVADMGIDSVGIHVETFDPAVLARVAPGKARWGIEAYFSAWERAVKAFGAGQVSTYVILGMGEDERTTVEGCKRAIDLGVYPFIVPLRPVPGSLMQDLLPPPKEAVEAVYRQVVPYLASKGMSSAGVTAGCARCQACSGMGAFERSDGPEGGLREGRASLPVFTAG